MVTSIPTPVSPSASVIRLPADHYLHPGAPTEWWWHTGTLTAGERVFGFEINAASFSPVGITQIMLTDVTNQTHFQNTTMHPLTNWAESDPTKDWYVKLGDPANILGNDWVTMDAPQADPTKNMVINASLKDTRTGTVVRFALTMSQDGPPFIVWGSGVMPNPPQPGGLTTNNFYYSLTRLSATGTISIGTESFAVTGLTWMDHEYGFFGSAEKPVTWFLQDLQLENGIHISHYATFSSKIPVLGMSIPSNATIQYPDGTTYYEQGCTMKPTGRTWISPTGALFFLEFAITIPAFEAEFNVTSLVDAQYFPMTGQDIYEGVASVEGVFKGIPVKGTAWNEQRP
jgi:predicted secreted hydrolase